jgi:aconitate hydratase 2/2-methylisocitrate dehydratase
MDTDLKSFASEYKSHLSQREAQGIPPLPLSADQAAAVCSALQQKDLDPGLLQVHGQSDSASSLVYLISERVPPGVYPASKVKAEFLADLVLGRASSLHLGRIETLEILAAMGGGYNIAPLIEILSKGGDEAEKAARLLEDLFLVGLEEVDRVTELARGGNGAARSLLAGWAEASWFSHRPEIPAEQRRMVIRTSGEINTDFFSPAQEASTRDDIPLHAQSILSTSPHDRDFIVWSWQPTSCRCSSSETWWAPAPAASPPPTHSSGGSARRSLTCRTSDRAAC